MVVEGGCERTDEDALERRLPSAVRKEQRRNEGETTRDRSRDGDVRGGEYLGGENRAHLS